MSDSNDILFDHEAAVLLGIKKRSVQVAIRRDALKGRVRDAADHLPPVYITTRGDVENYRIRRLIRGRSRV